MSLTIENDRIIARWLFLCALLIFAMVILGGVTRLTGSGLSMVNWHPIHGAIPPLSDQAWNEEFYHYQQSPEFQKKNYHYSLQEFKNIFYFEYAHRMLGRLIGLFFLIPFLYFYFTHKIKPGLTPRLIVMFILGGLQGLLGWYMVKSGLVDNPHVSQYRLTAHLIAAILIYGFILWTALGLYFSEPSVQRHLSSKPALRSVGRYLFILLLVTIISGGFVAGLKAGLIFNTYPTMHGAWIPEGLFGLKPLYLNFFENMVLVQFEHRVLTAVTGLLLVGYVLFSKFHRFDQITQSSFNVLGMAVVIQVFLGISTLLMHVPVWLAASHQAGALLLLTALLFNLHRLSRI